MRQNRNYNEIKASEESEQERKKAMCENRDDNEIKTDREYDQKPKKAEIENAFKAVENMSIVDPLILNTEAYKIIQKDFINVISDGPTYIFDICIEFHFKNNVMNLNPRKYDER